MNNYDGYTESEAMQTARAARMFSAMARNFVLSHTTEQDADDLAALVDVVNASEPLDTVDAQDAARWQDTPEYKEANNASDNFNFDTVQEVEF